MAKELNTKCRRCGGPVSPGCDFCSHICKRIGEAIPAKVDKPKSNKKDKE